MNFFISIEVVSLLNFILFSLLCFTKIENNIDINKVVYLFNLLFLSVTAFLNYYFVLNFIPNKLALVTSLLGIIIFLIFLCLSIISYQFLRLRILFIPFFLIILVFRFIIVFSSIGDKNEIIIFDNKLLVLHIITSLLSYSLITISLVTSFCSYIQDSYIKKMKLNSIIYNFLPSMYESELLAMRFLYLTMSFLIISLISGLLYFIETGQELIYFFNEKVIFSLLTLVLTLLIIFVRTIRGLSSQTTFKMILLSYLLISFSYFGIRILS